MLLLAKVNSILIKKDYKRSSVRPGGFCNGKVVFTLLAKVIILHVEPTIVDIQSFGLEFVSRRSTLEIIEECLNNFV